MVPKIYISQLTKKAKNEYFAALFSLESLHECISSLKKDLLNKENDYQFLINNYSIIAAGVVIRLLFLLHL